MQMPTDDEARLGETLRKPCEFMEAIRAHAAEHQPPTLDELVKRQTPPVTDDVGAALIEIFKWVDWNVGHSLPDGGKMGAWQIFERVGIFEKDKGVCRMGWDHFTCAEVSKGVCRTRRTVTEPWTEHEHCGDILTGVAMADKALEEVSAQEAFRSSQAPGAMQDTQRLLDDERNRNNTLTAYIARIGAERASLQDELRQTKSDSDEVIAELRKQFRGAMDIVYKLRTKVAKSDATIGKIANILSSGRN